MKSHMNSLGSAPKDLIKMKILFFLFICAHFIIGCKSKSLKEHHHTSKVDGYIAVAFKNKDELSIKINDEIQNFKLKVFHKDIDGKKLLFQSQEISTNVDLSDYTADLENGYVFAIVSGTLNNQSISKTSSFKLDEQNQIDYEKKLLQKRSLKYGR